MPPPQRDNWALNSQGNLEEVTTSVSNTLQNGTRIDLGNSNFEVFRITPNYTADYGSYEVTPMIISSSSNVQVGVWEANLSINITFRPSNLFPGEELLEVQNV